MKKLADIFALGKPIHNMDGRGILILEQVRSIGSIYILVKKIINTNIIHNKTVLFLSKITQTNNCFHTKI